MITTLDFLSALYQQGMPEGSHLELRIDTGQSLTRLWCQSLTEVIPAARAYIKDANSIWFGPGLRRQQSGHDIDVGWIPALWVDCDAKCFPNATKEEALECLRTIKPAPSIIIDTGHGVQGYWLLGTYAEHHNVLAARAAMKWLHYQLSSGLPKALDPVHNPSRVMRLPNTINRKDKSNPVPCVVVALEPSQVYQIYEFGAVDDDLAMFPADYLPTSFLSTDLTLRELSSKAVVAGIDGWVISAVYRPEFYYRGDASALDWKLAVELVKYLTLGEVEAIWLQSTWGYRDKVQQRTDYRRSTLWKARLYAEQKQQDNVNARL